MYIQVPTHHSLGESIGPFDGTFTGSVDGDAGSKATVTAALTHRDTAVTGKILIGRGLKLDFPGPCALEDVDLTDITIDTTWDPAKPLHLEANREVMEPTTQMGLTSIKIKVTLVADLSTDGKTMNVSVTMKPAILVCSARTLTTQLKR